MNRTLGWMVGIGTVGVVAAWALLGVNREPSLAVAETAQQPAAPSGAPAAIQAASDAKPTGAEKVVFTFDDEAKLKEFTALWDRRRAGILRMTVLQSYWNEEQATLAQLNKKLETDYKLDFNKDYYLDQNRRVIIERATPQTPPPPAEAPKP